MCALLRKNSALSRRIKNVEKELSAVGNDIKALSRIVKQAEHTGITPDLSVSTVRKNVEPEHPISVHHEMRIPTSVLKQPEVEYSQPRVSMDSASKRSVMDRDQITRDGRFATYLMSRDFHNVRPLRHERHVQRNKAIFWVIVALVLLYFVMSLIP